MIELNRTNTPYRLATKTKVDQMFAYPLALIRALAQSEEKNPVYKDLNQQAQDYYAQPEPRSHSSCTKYLLEENEEDTQLASAVKMLSQHKSRDIISAFKSAKSHMHSNANLTITTSHSSKGLSFDKVTLDDDCNDAIEDIMIKYKLNPNFIPNKEELQELNLAYVSISRSRFELHNCKYIDIPDI